MTRLKALLARRGSRPARAEIAELESRYRLAAREMDYGILLDLLRVSRYAEYGEMKALQFAYGLGYLDGKDDAR